MNDINKLKTMTSENKTKNNKMSITFNELTKTIQFDNRKIHVIA